MRNYIILNNKNSNTISGLIIQELAPISKPLQRTQVETIDGRDGDIVTPLGYAAYNKKIKIGLYGNFNINDIIAYFATKGTVIFSNEPDKYYYYQIVDQIDYERLVRYRVATVTMHVQPFKYSATEGTITVDSSDTVSDEGSDIALDGTAEAPFNVLRHKGNATQTTYAGKNLWGGFSADFSKNVGGITLVTKTDGTITTNAGTATAAGYSMTTSEATNNGFMIPLKAGTYTLSGGTSQVVLSAVAGGQEYRADTQTGKVTFTLASDTTGFVRLTIGNGIAVSAQTIKPMLELGSTASPYEPYTGSTSSQITPSPNPDYPQDIQVLTGDSTVKITGKNLWGGIGGSYSRNTGGIDFQTNTDGTIAASGLATSTVFSCNNSLASSNNIYTTLKAGTYYLSTESTPPTGVSVRIGKLSDGTTLAESPHSFTLAEDTNVYVSLRVASGTNISNGITVKPMVERNNQATTYEPYKGQSYVIPFGDTYLAKIGDYADEPVKVDGIWCIRRAIGKFIFDGTPMSGNISKDNNQSNTESGLFYCGQLTNADGTTAQYGDKTISDHLIAANVYNGSTHTENGYYIGQTNKTLAIRVRADVIGASMTVSGMTAWFSAHPTIFYYLLATPTDEPITDQDLIDALDDFINQAHAYKGHTHITATAADGNAPAVLAVDVNEDNESTVTNAGNTTSRPILTIYGQGDIGVYINDVEVLDVALGDEGYITLDSVEMEAYKDTTANLKNRLVTGDYSMLALNAGANKIRFTGKVTKYEIFKYSRWL